MFFMHTVKAKEDIKEAYMNYGIKDFSLDTKEELLKILENTNGAKDLNLLLELRYLMSTQNLIYQENLVLFRVKLLGW